MPDTTARPTPAWNVLSPLSRQPVRPRPATAPRQARWPIYLFFLGLIVPIQIFAGPVRLTGYGIVLLCLIVPCMIILRSFRFFNVTTVFLRNRFRSMPVRPA